MVYTDVMATEQESVRQSVSLPSGIAKRVKSLARSQRTSANRVLVELIEKGLDSKEAERRKFFELADQLSSAKNPAERKRLKKQLARITFRE